MRRDRGEIIAGTKSLNRGEGMRANAHVEGLSLNRCRDSSPIVTEREAGSMDICTRKGRVHRYMYQKKGKVQGYMGL